MFFRVLALLILAVFYSGYFLKMLMQRKKGIRTDQIGRGKTGFPRLVEELMRLATLAAPLAEVAGIALDRFRGPVWLRALGLLLAVLGTALFLAAMAAMGESWRAGVSGDKTALVTGGVFRYSRNPAFLGFDLVYLGLLLAFFSLPLCLVSLFAMGMLHLQIVNNEEDAMLLAFGEEYLEYKSRVRRYLGRK